MAVAITVIVMFAITTSMSVSVGPALILAVLIGSAVPLVWRRW